MGIEKDTTFKFIGKNFLNVLFSIAHLPNSIDAGEIKEVTEDMISLTIAQYKPDFIGRGENVIVMFEYESSFVGLPSRKRFHAYVALYDYEKNDDNLDIIFCVITTKERSKIVEHKIGDTDTFKILIFNINELGFEKIISNTMDKIEKQEKFPVEELVKLALTSLMPGTREGNIKQFKALSQIMDKINFESEHAKVSFCGMVLLLSNMYFEKNDPIRKKIQGEFMEKVDCIVERFEEEFNNGYNNGFNNGFNNGLLESVKLLLEANFSFDYISKKTGFSIEDIEKIYNEIKVSG